MEPSVGLIVLSHWFVARAKSGVLVPALARTENSFRQRSLVFFVRRQTGIELGIEPDPIPASPTGEGPTAPAPWSI